MENQDFIREMQQRVDKLKIERDRIEQELKVAEDYLRLLLCKNKKHSISDKTVSHSQESIDKMKKAQKERQERERRFRKNEIIDFLNEKEQATTEEIANHLKLGVATTLRSLRSYDVFTEIRKGVWKYYDDTFIPF